jgi:aspartate racemase
MGKKKPTIGIIGGAGPMAGVLLFRYIIEISQHKYGCKEDADFPKILLMSIPFSQMLMPGLQSQAAVSKELSDALKAMLAAGMDHIGIACNTLHGFLNKNLLCKELIHLVDLLHTDLSSRNIHSALVLATQTSAIKKVHAHPCIVMPSRDLQQRVDALINSILEGNTSKPIQIEFENVLKCAFKENSNIEKVILGCTELSVLSDKMESCSVWIDACIDPLKILAEKLCVRALKAFT